MLIASLAMQSNPGFKILPSRGCGEWKCPIQDVRMLHQDGWTCDHTVMSTLSLYIASRRSSQCCVLHPITLSAMQPAQCRWLRLKAARFMSERSRSVAALQRNGARVAAAMMVMWGCYRATPSHLPAAVQSLRGGACCSCGVVAQGREL